MRLVQYLIFALAIISASTSYAKVEVIRNSDETIYQIGIDRVDVREVEVAGKKYSQAKLIGAEGYEGILYNEGNPEIPVVRLVVSGGMPMISSGAAQKKLLSNNGLALKPVQPSLAKIAGAKANFRWNAKSYQQNNFMPARAYEVSRLGSSRGEQQLLITLHPVSYNPTTGQIQLTNQFEVRVPYHANRKEMAAAGAPKGIALIVGAKFANSPALARYAEFKRGLGMRVETIVVGSDANTPEQIRAKLQQLYAMNSMQLKYALLVGDAEDVPSHPSRHISGVTDHFYACLDTADYESDIQTPDISVGRFSVANEAQLSSAVEKSIAYQRGIFKSEPWLNSIAYLATNDKYQVAEGTHNYAIDTYTAPAGYVGIFPAANQPGGDKLYAITYHVQYDTVQQALRDGRTIIDYSGHGAQTFWDAPRVSQEDVRAMGDESALPFVIGNACVTGDFRVPESFGETWIRHRYGAILYWGSMDSSYWDEDDILERRMFDGIYAHGQSTFGEITDYAQIELTREYGGAGRSTYYWETYHLFGDPSIDLRTTRTQMAQVEGPTQIPLGAYPLQYTIYDGQKKPMAGVNVTFSVAGGNMLASMESDANGMVSFTPAAEIPAGTQLKIAVHGKNLRESTLDVQLISPNTAYLNAKDIHISGRMDLVAGPGEEIALAMNVLNVGLVGTQGAMLGIESVTGPADVITGNAGLSALAPGQSVALDGSQFRLRVRPSALGSDSLRVNFVWTTTEGETGRFSKNIAIARGQISVAAVDFGNPASEEEGGIHPGSAGSVYLTLVNSGTETMNHISLGAIGDTCTASIEGLVAIESLAPGEKVRVAAPLTIAVASNCHNGENVKFRLEGNYIGMGGSTSLSSMAEFVSGSITLQEAEVPNLNLAIPDAAAAVDQDIIVSKAGKLRDIGVSVRITHSYSGDLVVQLVHPTGVVVTLQKNEGGSTPNIDATYGMGGMPVSAMKQLVGLASQGTWKLRVQDNSAQDRGTLNYVKLSIKGFFD